MAADPIPTTSPRNPTGDPSRDDLYEDQVPPHAPGVSGNAPAEADEPAADDEAARDGDKA